MVKFEFSFFSLNIGYVYSGLSFILSSLLIPTATRPRQYLIKPFVPWAVVFIAAVHLPVYNSTEVKPTAIQDEWGVFQYNMLYIGPYFEEKMPCEMSLYIDTVAQWFPNFSFQGPLNWHNHLIRFCPRVPHLKRIFCVKPLTNINIHSVIVLLMDGIIMKRNYSSFLLETTGCLRTSL